METQRRIVCPACSKTFMRRAHMLRHQQQHISSKPFSCMFCSKQFQRKDVLRGHLFRCDQRGSLAVPEKQCKGRKRSSCDSCVSLRIKCDPETPCTRCRELGKPCIKSPGTIQRPPEPPDTRSHEQISINFLLNGPENDDFTGRFPTSQTRAEQQENHHQNCDGTNGGALLLDHPVLPSDWGERIDDYDAFFGADMSFDSFFGSFEKSLFGSPLDHSGTSHIITDQATAPAVSLALENRALEIRQQLRQATANFGNFNEARLHTDLEAAIELITPFEIENCTALFFEHYHRHCPIVHRPSFNSAHAPLPLLMSVICLGGMYSKDPGKVTWLKRLLDTMETYIYGLPGVHDDYDGSFDLSKAADEDTLYFQFEILQGAYLMVVAQYFSGSMTARKRARQQRFTRVLAIARSFKLPRAQHPCVVSIPDDRSFRLWVRQESQIRTMNIILSLDSAFGIFNNIPPRIDLCELDLHLPCDRQFFETASHDDMIIHSLFPRQKMKVFEAFQKLFMEKEGAEGASVVDRGVLNSWDLLILIHLIYTFTWRQTFSNPLLRQGSSLTSPPPAIIDPLKLAIRNWKTTWDETRAAISPRDLHEMGFESSADSYWTLTRLLVFRFDSVGPGGLEVMPLESDCSSQASHLRRILAGVR